MDYVIVLAMHGAPPNDFPREAVRELMGLHGRLEQMAPGPEKEAAERRFNQLDGEMRDWPRNAGNDPYWAGSSSLAEALRTESGTEVVLGFNEFCAPSLAAALDEAAGKAGKIFVITPMMTRGGEHSEVEIPQEVDSARSRHPGVEFTYVWPLELTAIARFLAEQIEKRLR
ncbi:MAG: sirohydrochlorin chelatase [Candidatus Aquicultorales bacterium]